MSNEILWVLMLMTNFLVILGLYRFAGRLGMYAWISISVIIANLQVIKTVEIFGLTTTLGNIVYATSFLATDILSENHGYKDARKAIMIGFVALLSLTVFMNLALLFEPARMDFAHESMKSLYSFLPRIALASFAAYAVSQFHDVWIYAKLKRRWKGLRWLWLRNNFSTMISQALDTLIFCLIAFYGVLPGAILLEIMVTTYIFKWIVAVADTPMIYISRKISDRFRLE